MARERIGRMEPDNQPQPARRRPPDDDPEPTPSTQQAQPPATIDTGSEPRNLGRFLGGPEPEAEPQTTSGSGASVQLSALAGHRRVDPDRDLVQLNVTIPWYVRRAIELTCTAEQVRLRELILHWARQGLSQQLLADCRAAAERDRGGPS